MRILEDAKQKVNPKLMELFHTAPRGKGGRGRGGGGGFGGRGRGGGGSSRVLLCTSILIFAIHGNDSQDQDRIKNNFLFRLISVT